MKSGQVHKGEFVIRYTSNIETYRYAIFKGEHLVSVGTGSGPEKRITPTVARMRQALNSHLRLYERGKP